MIPSRVLGSESTSVAASLSQYLEVLKRRVRDITYYYHVKLLERHIPDNFFESPYSCAQSIVKNISNLSPATQHSYIKTIRAFASWCALRGLVDPDTIDLLQPPRVERVGRPRTLSWDQLRDVQRAALNATSAVWPPYACMAWVLLHMHAGLRAKEAALLSVGEIDLQRKLINLYPTIWRPLKSSAGMRSIPMTSALATFVEQCCVNKGPEERLFKFTGGRAYAMIAAIKEAHGAGPTLLRHTFASALAQGGIGVWRLMYLMGHGSPTVTSTYYVGDSEGIPDLDPATFAHGPGIGGNVV